MSKTNQPFDQRVGQIVRKHEMIAKGSVKGMSPDGLIVERPRGFRLKFPLRAILALLVVGQLIKVAFLVRLGAEAYEERVLLLAQGNVADQAGAWLLQIDPVTQSIASLIAPYLG